MSRADDHEAIRALVHRYSTLVDSGDVAGLGEVAELHDELVARLPEQGPARLVHGDYGLHNCLSARGGFIAAVVDWEISTLGDPLADPSQFIQGSDGYKRQSHELRISSPSDNRLRFVGGLFYQDQEHEIFQNYKINGIGGFVSGGELYLVGRLRDILLQYPEPANTHGCCTCCRQAAVRRFQLEVC